MFNSFLLFTTTAWFLASLLLMPLLFLIVRQWGKVGGLRAHHWLLLGFIAFFLLSFAFRQQPYGYQELIAYSVGPLAFLWVTRSDAGPRLIAHRRLLSWTIAGVAGVLALIGLATFPFEHVTRLSSLFRGVEPFSTFPNTLAMFLLIALPFQVFLFLTEERNAKVVAAGMFFLSFAAFFLTFSRGAYLALFGALVVGGIVSILFIRKEWKKALRPSAVILAIGALALVTGFAWNDVHRAMQPADLAARVPLTEDIFGRVTDQETSADQSTDERLEFWKGSLVLIGQHPWLGVGSDGFRFQYPALQNELLALSTHPHNIFLKIAVENGLPAAFLFLLFTTFLLMAFMRRAWQDRASGTLSFDLALLAAFLAAHLHLLTDYNLNAVAVWLPYWLVLILMGSRLRFLPASRISRGTTVLMALAIVGVLVVSGTSFVQYRFVKSAQAQASTGNTQPLVDILTSPIPHPFQSLAYEEVGTSALRRTLSPLQIEQLAPVVETALVRYFSWPELRIAYARILTARGRAYASQAQAQYKTALAGNAGNSLDWHLEYLRVLQVAADREKDPLGKKSGFYRALMGTYLEKLKVNAHRTITSDNPRAGAEIIRVFLASTTAEEKRKWAALNNEYLKVWRQEREKFQAVFPGTVVPE